MRGRWTACYALAGAMALALALPCFAEELGPDGFPLDYQPGDLAVGGPVVATPTLVGAENAKPVVSGVSASAVVTPTGTSFKIEDLPRVSSTVLLEPSKTVAEAPVVGELPQPARMVAPKLPKDAQAMAAWGPLTARTGGLGGSLWAGVSRSTVDGLLRGIVAGGARAGNGDREAALGHLVERLLLTGGAAPVADGEASGWLERRAEVLDAMGRDEAAWRLWQAVPVTERARDMKLARGWTEAALVAGDVATACGEVRDRILKAEGADKPFWQQSVVVCQLLQDQEDGARLSWQLATETPGAVSPVLASVVTAWLQDKPVVMPKGSLARDGSLAAGRMPALAAALLAARPDLLNGALLDALPSVALRRVANSAGLPMKMRMAAAELLAHRTRLAEDGQAVRVLYMAQTFDGAARTDPVGTAKGLGDGIAARALLWQVASDAEAPVSLRMACWQRWRQVALANGLPGLLETLPVAMTGLKPNEDTAALAPLVLADAWRAGDVAAAQVWLGVLNGMKVLPAGVSSSLPQLRLQGTLLTGRSPAASVWRDWLAVLDPKASTRTLDAGRILAVAGQIGARVPDEVGMALLAPAAGDLPEPAPGAFWREALLAAARDGRVGVAVLLLAQPQAGENPLARGWLEVRMDALKRLGEDVLGDGDGSAMRLAGIALAQGVDAVEGKAVAGMPLPKVNFGTAPVSKGREIGGGRLKMTPAGGSGDEFLLPPPRVPAPKAPTAPKVARP